MKKTNLSKIFAAALAALPLLTAPAKANTILDGVTNNANGSSIGNYQAAYPGDIFLGFSSSSLGKNYVVDLGSIDQVKGFNVGSFLSLNSDLVSTFGATWYSTSDLTWGLFGLVDDGGGTPVDALVSLIKGNDGSTLATPSVIQGSQHGQLDSIVSQLNFDAGYSGALTYGVYQNNGNNGDSKANNMWLGIADTATPFGIFNQSIVGSAYFSGGVTDTNRSNLELFDVSADGVTVTKNSTFLALDAQGNVTAVPEPSTWALFGLGVLLTAVAYRRKARA